MPSLHCRAPALGLYLYHTSYIIWLPALLYPWGTYLLLPLVVCVAFEYRGGGTHKLQRHSPHAFRSGSLDLCLRHFDGDIVGVSLELLSLNGLL